MTEYIQHITDMADVKHIFFYKSHLTGKEYLLLIFKDNRISKQSMSLDEFKKKCNSILDTWKAYFPGVKCFEYPRWYVKREKTVLRGLGISVLLLLVFLSIFAALSKANTLPSPLFLFVIGMLAIFSFGFFYFSSPNRYFDIYLAEDSLILKNNKGEKVYGSDGISRCEINKPTGNVLYFKDGIKIENLERLSYWPILNDYLRSRFGY